MLKRLTYLWQRHRDDERGVTSLEFVFAATLFMMILFWTIETGFIMVRWIMLERGVDIAARELRLYGLPEELINPATGEVPNAVAHEYVRDSICSHAKLIDDCENVLLLQLTTVDADTGVPNVSTDCVDRTGPVIPATDLPTVSAGVRPVADSRDLMYLRACVVIDPILPANYAMPLPYDASGGVAVIVDSAYVNEPE
jgi:hypothetical protein